MGNDGLPASIAVLLAVVILSALGFMAYVVSTVVNLGTPAG
jgi:hypothetical protein